MAPAAKARLPALSSAPRFGAVVPTKAGGPVPRLRSHLPPALFFSDPAPSGGTPSVERGQPKGPTNSCERNLSLSSTPPGPPLPPVQNEELERDEPRPVKCHSSKRPFKSVWLCSSTSQTGLIPRRVQPPTQRALRETSCLPARGLGMAARGCRNRSPSGRTVTSR